MKVRRALISVSDKTGIVGFARSLADAGVAIVSSGGTATALSDAGVPVDKVSEVTGSPEILDGRVKTLHPKIHAGILADRSKPEHLAQLDEQGIEPIDLVVCNLYPFEKTIAAGDVSEADAVEQIDIGGPAMVRAAAKNFHSVAVVVNPGRYEEVASQIADCGEVSTQLRRELALEAFSHTAAYDGAIATYLSGEETWPSRLVISGKKVTDLRYGENPHQSAAFYATGVERSGLAAAEQLHGKELSYNNLLDADAAWKLVNDLAQTGVAIIKHSNPCGVAIADSLDVAYERALDCDRTSAFGGIVALNKPCDRATAEGISQVFTEVVIAPDYSDEALEALTQKKNVRILKASPSDGSGYELRRIAGGLLVQSPDELRIPDAFLNLPPGEHFTTPVGIDPAHDAKVVTRAQPTAEQSRDLRFAWVVAKHTKSNAIVLVKDGMAVGVGAGQMSRVEATELAARRAGDRAAGTACASDAFFPFRDGLDAAVEAGAVAVIQPGGSVRDDEVIEAADEHGIPMLFTGRRHFRH